ncbi:helix-turn-helix domain-containing protein [Geofilum sp. OHC36d9]|uniref:helix-turn-helix domain-containing protein n=1 Tax=Geofilum sp. OHC36d9 TaxID=3458413 RepID=UPI004034BADA
MSIIFKVPDKGDPSNILQLFPSYKLQLLCCRYWWLRKWEFRQLSFPYWRMYWNKQDGAHISYNGTEYPLTKDKIMLIAPNTAFATRLYYTNIPNKGYELEGNRADETINESQLVSQGCIMHLFIHFNIGMPYDNIAPGIFIFDINSQIDQKLNIIIDHLHKNATRFNFFSALTIQSLISHLLSNIPESNWNTISKDHRILEILSFIDNHLYDKILNETLAETAKLSTNAFTRLFKNEVGISPQRYVRQKRIDKACVLLHHSALTIDEVASQSGFANRYHFSREFKSQTGLPPALYRKELR